MERIETTILRNLIFDEEYSRKVIPFIEPEYFENKTEKIIFEEVTQFIVKYDANGSRKWTNQIGSARADYGSGITTDTKGNVYLLGQSNGSIGTDINFGSGGFIVVKYDNTGTLQWINQYGTKFQDIGKAITIDANDNVYVTGETSGGLDGNTSAGDNDLFVVKYNSSGVKQWTKQLGTSSSDYGYGITSDSSGNLYVTGRTNGGLDGNTSAGDSDIFVVKYNSDGVKQ